MNYLKKISNNKILLLLVLFLFAFSIRLVYLLEMKSNPLSSELIVDELAYYSNAVKIASGNWTGDEIFFQSPLYPYMLAFIFKIFGKTPFVIRFIQIISGSVGCVLLFLIGKKYFNTRTGAIAFLFSALYGFFVFQDALVLKESTVICLNNLLLYLLLDSRHSRKTSGWFFSGIILGLIVLLRENILLYVPFIILWIFIDFREKWVKSSLLVVAGTACLVLPVTARNFIAEKDLVLISSQGGVNFYIGNNPNATGIYAPLIPGRQTPKEEKRDAFYIAMKEEGRKLKPSQVSAFWFRKGIDFIITSPVKFVRLTAKKFLIFCNNNEIPDAIDFNSYRQEYPVLKIAFVRYGYVFAMAIAGVFFIKERRKCLLFYFFIIAAVLSVVPFYIYARYRLIAVPVLMISGSYALSGLWEKIERGDSGYAASFIVVFLLAFAFTNIPVMKVNSAFAETNRGAAFMKQENYDNAIACFNSALAKDPQYVEAYINMGLAYSSKGMSDKALFYFDKAIETNPANPETFINRGALYTGLALYDKAVSDYEEAIRLVPENAQGYYNLGVVHTRMGLIDRAIADYTKVLEIEPASESAHKNIGLLYREEGMYDRMAFHWQRYVELNPSAPDRDLILSEIRKIR